MSRVLVTGGAGFVGSHVVDRLRDEGMEVAVVDHFSTGNRDFLAQGISVFEVDINSEELQGIFEQFRPDIVVHLAAQSSVPHSLADPVYDAQVNISGTIHILELCRRMNVKRIIYSSSAALYGHVDADQLPLDEQAQVRPLSAYGLSKHTGERYISMYEELYGVPFTILRFANVYGPRQTSGTESGVISIFIEDVLQGRTPVIFGDGYQTRDFIYVRDIAEAVIASAQEVRSAVYHVSSARETSIIELLQTICRLMNVPFTPIFKEMKPGDIRRSCLGNERIMSQLSWEPSTSLEDGLRETIQFFQGLATERRLKCERS